MSGHTSWRAVPHELHEPLWYVVNGHGDLMAAHLTKEDACVIAATPDLLEAAKEALPVLEAAHEDDHRASPAWRHLRAAIAKAEGRNDA